MMRQKDATQYRYLWKEFLIFYVLFVTSASKSGILRLSRIKTISAAGYFMERLTDLRRQLTDFADRAESLRRYL